MTTDTNPVYRGGGTDSGLGLLLLVFAAVLLGVVGMVLVIG
jgi:hypothetical protein